MPHRAFSQQVPLEMQMSFRQSWIRLAGAATAAILLAAACVAPAQATAFCEIVKTRDGFVALRDRPSTSGRLIARLREGAEIQLKDGEKNGWSEVGYRPKAQSLYPEGKVPPQRIGWVRKSLIRDCG
jgi:hypothetical protein